MTNIFDQNLKEYQKYLMYLLNNKSAAIITNGGVEHAAVLMATLFDSSQENILMFSRGLNPELTDKEIYYAAFENYIKRGGKLSLLVETTNHKNSRMFSFLREQLKKNNDNIVIREIKEDDKKQLFENLKSDHCNFSVFDSLMVRFEYDPKEYKAFGSFNYEEMATHLSKEFNHAFNNAIPFSERKNKDDE